jgi:hypothetical protein
LADRRIAVVGTVLIILGLIVGYVAFLPGPGPEGDWKFDFLPGVEGKFAQYSSIGMTFTADVAPYVIDRDLGNVRNAGEFRLSDGQVDMLYQNGFFAEPSSYDEVYELYKAMKERNIPIFVTTDSLLHAYHILYDYVLRQVEHHHFADSLLELTEFMASESLLQYTSIEDGDLKEAARLNLAFFTVAGRLLDPKFDIDGSVREDVKAELDLIEAHAGFEISPIMKVKEDYSQYVPRGHYTRSELFKSYFKAMIWYGRIPFTLKMSDAQEHVEIGRAHTRQALLIIGTLNTGKISGEKAISIWESIYEPTVFFVGRTDDLDLYDYSDLALEVFGENVGIEGIGGDIDAFISQALELPGPRISSTGSLLNMQGFRFMGQRFIPDSYMFQELVYPKTSRLMPKGLDVMVVLGSDRAWEHLADEWDEANFREQIEKLKAEFGSLVLEDWTQNLYWLWLYTLRPLLAEKEGGYPSFMLSEAWMDKELSTALGSWTELRHDTILYAKQSYTLESAPPQPEFVEGYVEPNPELYSRLASLAAMTREGLLSRGLLSEEFKGRLERMEELSRTLMEISVKELEEESLTNSEYEEIWNIGGTLEYLITAPASMAEMVNEADTRMPVVADVHTDPNSGTVLEEGTGYPMMLYVIAPVKGQLCISVGAAFSYHEFTQPMSERLTDEAWQEMLDSGKAPELPFWTGSYVS